MAAAPKHLFRKKLAAAGALVALADWLLWQRELIATGIGWLALAWVVAVVLVSPAVRRDRRARAAAAAAALFAGVHIWDPGLLSWGLFWGALMMAVLLPREARFKDAFFWLQQQGWTALAAAFGPVIDMKRIATVPSASVQLRVRQTLPMLLLPLVGGAIFVALFARANPIIDDLFSAVSVPEMEIARAILWGVFFVVAWSAFRPRRVKRALAVPLGEMALLERIPAASITISLVLFNAIFAAQNLLDVAVLWSGAGLPDSMTYAEYAHRGAYPLILTALLAGLFVITLLRPGSATARRPMIQRLVILWVVQNVFLMASAMLRLELYVEAYQLTPLRITAFVWMLLVAVGLGLICWRVVAGKSAAWLVNGNAAAALTVLAVMSLLDLSATAAWYNISHSHEADGDGARLDLCYLEGQDSSALLPLIALESRLTDGNFRDRVANARRRVHGDLQRLQASRESWTWREAQRLAKAERRLAEMGDADRWVPELNCGGQMSYVSAWTEPEPIAVDVQPPVIEVSRGGGGE
ncbi:MAG: DUF4173 domain-containing protein [Pacificimonas sp.]